MREDLSQAFAPSPSFTHAATDKVPGFGATPDRAMATSLEDVLAFDPASAAPQECRIKRLHAPVLPRGLGPELDGALQRFCIPVHRGMEHVTAAAVNAAVGQPFRR
jgi:hypothetical protein